MKYLTLSGRRKGLTPGCRGASTMGCLLFLLIAGAVGYVGFKVGQAYWNYFEVRQKTKEVLNWAVAGSPKSDGDIVQKVIVNAKGVGAELYSRNIQIIHTADTLTIIVSWGQEVEFPYYTLPLNFKTTQTEEKRWYKGGLIIKEKP